MGHQLSRRQFLGTAAGVTAASLLSPVTGAAWAQQRDTPSGTNFRTVPPGRLGIQQWSVRTATGGDPTAITDAPTGFRQVFEALSDLGYRGFEFFQYSQHTAHLGRQITISEIRDHLDATGLRAFGVHLSYGAMSTPAGREAQFEIAHQLGMEMVGTANNPLQGIANIGDPASHTPQNWEQAAERDNEIGAHAQSSGLQWYQHNHQNEFRFLTDGSGRRGYEYWVEQTDPALVHVQLDVYWAHVARLLFQTYIDADGNEQTSMLDPLAFSLSLGNRVSSFHIKDGVPSGDSLTFTNVGEGILPLHEFSSAQPARGSKLFIAERDSVSAGAGSDAARRMADAAVHAETMLGWRG